MKLSLFKKQMLLMAAVSVVFLSIGFIASLLVSQIDRQRFEASPTMFIARLIDDISERYHVSREDAFGRVKESNKSNNPAAQFVEMEILDREHAKTLLGPEHELPEGDYDAVLFGHHDLWHFPSRMIRLKGGEEFLKINYRPHSSPLHRIFNPNSAVLIVSIFLASFFSMFVLFYSMRSKAHLAAQIINEKMRGGNLSARFPVGKMDEVGQLMLEFNKMADEIQRLVETIKNNEQVRMRRLQELAHDLRTPVASLEKSS